MPCKLLIWLVQRVPWHSLSDIWVLEPNCQKSSHSRSKTGSAVWHDGLRPQGRWILFGSDVPNWPDHMGPDSLRGGTAEYVLHVNNEQGAVGISLSGSVLEKVASLKPRDLSWAPKGALTEKSPE